MDSLSKLTFKQSGGDTFIKFEDGKALKLRVYTTNPMISLDSYGNTKYSFAVWDYESGKAKLLSKGSSIAKPISELHTDEDYGSDITKQDIKITPSGDGMERRYTINVLPKPQNLTTEAQEEMKELDSKLEKIFPNGIRADSYIKGSPIPAPDEVADVDYDAVNLNDLPDGF